MGKWLILVIFGLIFLLKITLFQQVYPNKPHGPPKMISQIQLLNEGPKEDSWTLKKPINYIFVDHFIKKR